MNICCIFIHCVYPFKMTAQIIKKLARQPLAPKKLITTFTPEDILGAPPDTLSFPNDLLSTL